MSRITNRKGLHENIPQLAGAELGWSLDERRLFIGNGNLVDGAPTIGNTELLTEYSDILAMSSTYTYQGTAAGYVTVTGDGTDILRSLQSKFDDFASVKDFGAIGDGITDDTAAINRALFELFCRIPLGDTTGRSRRSLYFPAGTYRVTGSIKIPPHAKLWGEGLTSSVIKFIPLDPIAATAIVIGERYVITTVGDTDFISIGAAADTVGIEFVATGVGAGTGTATARDAQVAETADDLQQTGINIGTNSATKPTGIEINAMGIHSDVDNTLLKLDSVTNSGFSYLGLAGPNTNPSVETGTAAIEIATSVSVTSNITISKLSTFGTTFGLKAAGDVKGVVLENSGLDFHFKGVHVVNPTIAATATANTVRYKIITVGTTDYVSEHGAEFNREGVTFTATGVSTGSGTVISMDDPGPTGVVVSRNIFDNIASAGIHFENTLFNSSGYNVFYDVANNIGGTPLEPVIIMETDQCLSVGDLFEREDESVKPRISLAGNGGIYIDSTHSIHLGSYERQVGLAADMSNTAVNEALLNNVNIVANSYKIDYNISNSTQTRMGTMLVSVNDLAVTYTDEYTEAGTAIPVTLEAVSAGTNNDSTLRFTSTETATINFSVVRLD